MGRCILSVILGLTLIQGKFVTISSEDYDGEGSVLVLQTILDAKNTTNLALHLIHPLMFSKQKIHKASY